MCSRCARFALLLVLACVNTEPVLAIPPPWQPASRFELRDAIVPLVERLDGMARPQEPGFAIMVFRDGKPVLTRYSGVESLETGAPITAETRFYIASIAKSFTATAVLLLYERGQLHLEDPVSRWVDGLPACMRDVRIHHLLNHTSGIPDYFEALGDQVSSKTNADILAFVRRLDALEFDPGVRYAYSNTGYVLLAEILERVSGKSYREILEENIFKPLNMTHTVVVLKGTPEFEHRARGYRRDGDRFVPDDYRDLYTVGSGGVYSTLEDLARWYEAVVQSRLLKPTTAAVQFYPPVTLSGRRSYLGMGWSDETFGPKTPELDGLRCYASIGLLRGFRGMIQLFPDHGFGWIFLSNAGEMAVLGPDAVRLFFSRAK
jgi:CubicO group peptidase (beta-lactamase class C family)